MFHIIRNYQQYQKCLSSMKLFCTSAFIILLIRNFSFSQFHQDDYNIVHDRIDILKVNKTVAPDLTLKVFKYNDTLKMKAINYSVHHKLGVRKNILLTFVAYKAVNKIYRPFPVPNINLDVCEEYRKLGESNPFGIQAAISSSNFRGCPCAPGLFYMNAFVLQDDKFPPHLPPGEYKLTILAVTDDDIFTLEAEWYGAIVRRKKKNKH